MSDLRKAAQALVDRWDTPLWKDVPHTGQYIDALRTALAQPEQEQLQEPVAWLSIDCIGERYLCFSNPMDNDEVHALYTAPPQRKPLTEREIRDMFYDSLDADQHVVFIDLVRAIEKAHGIGDKE